jgi:hypothetical protein
MRFKNFNIVLVQELITLGAKEWEASELANHINSDSWADKDAIKAISSELWESELATREALNA